MLELKPKTLKVATIRLNDWVEYEDGSFRSGNVVLRNEGGSRIRADWRIYCVDDRGRLVMVSPKSRPWGYGHVGQAKIGAAHIVKPQVVNPVPEYAGEGAGI